MKKIAKYIILVLIFSLINITYAEEIGIRELTSNLENNSTLQILDLNVKNMEIDIYKAELSSMRMENTLDKLRSFGRTPSGTALTNMMFVINIVPKQVEYGLYVLENNKEIIEETLNIATRQMAMGIINLENTYNLNLEKRDFYDTEYENGKLSYELGIISETELLESEVKYFESEINLSSSIRNLSDMYNELNKFLGYDLSKEYTISKENQMNGEINEPDYYLEFALENRFEIKNIEYQISLQEEIIYFYNYGNHLAYYENYKALRDAENERDRLLLELEIVKKSIAEEIYRGVSDIKILDYQINQLENTLAMQNSNYENLLKQVELGYMTDSMIKELEFAIISIENNLDLLNYSYNTKRYEFYNATQIGPSYGGVNL